jgi:hypothetical protein
MRISQSDNLPTIRWIGENFLIARHSRIKYDFTGNDTLGTDRGAVKYRAIPQYKNGWRTRRHDKLLILLDLQGKQNSNYVLL